MRAKLILAVVGFILSSQAAETNLTVLKAGRLIDVVAGKVLTQQTILIEGDLIKEVGASDSVNVPAAAKVIDLSNATVLPGLIDCHTHITSQPEDYYADIFRKSPIDVAITAHVYARRTLEAGFTTCRNLGADEFVDIALKKAIEAGKIPGPRLFVSGMAIGSTGGHADLSGFSPYIEFKSFSSIAVRAIYSLDGVTWSRSSIAPATVAYGDRGFVAVRTFAWRSIDGINWDEPMLTATPSISLCSAYGSGYYIAGGDGGSLQRSSDGLAWELLNSGVTNDITGLAYGNGVFVATGPAGLILTSTNTVQWSRAESHTAYDLSAPAFAHNMWVIVGAENCSCPFKAPLDSVVLSSTNAFDWEISPSKPEQPLFAVAATSDGFYAVGCGTFRSGYFGPASFAGLTTGPNVELQVHGQIGKTYQLQSVDALGSAEWQNIGPVVQTNEVQSITDDAATGSMRFYRLFE